jgi:hypothetical protein
LGFQLAGYLHHQLHANKFSVTIQYRVISRLLTHHAGGKHGDEEDLRWRFSSPAGCQKELLDPPNLGSTTAADRDVFLEN